MRFRVRTVNEAYKYALKLLAGRDLTTARLREKLEARFGRVPQELFDELIRKRYLDDRRFAENYVARRKNRGASRLREELAAWGVAPNLAEEVVSSADWPSLHEALNAKMADWNLRAPLQLRDAARLFRGLLRLGYSEDEIAEALKQLNDR
jgi:SOS response regulatory protein OraA/RecX